MTEIPTPPTDIKRQLKAFAFDLDGTIYLGSRLLPGVVDLLGLLRHSSFPTLFVTNNSSQSRHRYLQKLADLGIELEPWQLLTSNDVAIRHLQRQDFKTPLLLAVPEVEEEYRASGFQLDSVSPDCVLLTFDKTIDYDKLCKAAHWIRQDLPYFATHPDLVCPTPDGPIPDCGSFIALLEAATGRRPHILGKPEAPLARAISELCHVPPDAIAFVGDRLYTDVRLANEHGFFSILTLTGEATREDLTDSLFCPDLVVDSLEVLLEQLQHTSKS